MSKLQNLQVFRKPQKFISFNGKVLKINEEVLSELRTISGHLKVVTAVGAYRTGKSWILNQLAGCGNKDGFGVADGQTGVTKGIWIVCREHPEKKDCILVFLDTEGLHDPFKRDTTNDDNHLFIVSFLLSDTFIYNVMKQLNDHDLEKIGFISNICKNILPSEAKKTFPEFLLLLRDVAKLKLDGELVEPNEYFEKVLDSGNQSTGDLSPKRCIKQLCTRRSCFALTQPVEFESLEDLGEIDHPSLTSKFQEQFGRCNEHIHKKSDIKRLMNGTPYTTKAFCEFIREVVAVVDSDKIPQIECLQIKIARDENELLWKQITEDFKGTLRDETKIELYGTIQDVYTTKRANCLKQLEMQMLPIGEGDLQETQDKFKVFAKKEYEALSRRLCTDLLEGHLDTYFDKVRYHEYKSPDAVKHFQEDIDRVKATYERKMNLGPEKNKVWTEKEKEIAMMKREVEIQDLQHKLTATSQENKLEREKIDKKLHEMKQEYAEEKRRFERNQKELEEERRRDEQKREREALELDQKRQREIHELEQKRQRDAQKIQQLQQQNQRTLELIQESNKRNEALVGEIKEMKAVDAAVAEQTNNANVVRSAIEGIAILGVATINALKSDD